MSNNLMTTIQRNLSSVSFTLQKHSPEILVVAGVIGVGVGAVMACKATTKIDTILDNTKEKLDTIKEATANEEISDEEYTAEDAQRDTVIVYSHAALDLIKLYAPSVIVGGLSIASILASNNILRKRNVALAAAYVTIDRGFKEYRNNVKDRFGAEVDHELKYNIRPQEIEEKITDEKGKEKTVKKTIRTAKLNESSTYARWFNKSNPNWENNNDYNLMFLRAQQNYANDVLKAKGHLFLNDAYRMIGLEETKEGQIVGWLYDPSNPIGDNFVDFGIYDVRRDGVKDFLDGKAADILLDFNVDGNIWDKM